MRILKVKDIPKTFKKNKFGTFDIETKRDVKTGGANANNFIYGVVFDGKIKHIFHDKNKMFNFMCLRKFKGFKWFAHKAEYDLNGLMENIIKDTDKVLFADSRLIFAERIIHTRTDKKGHTHNEKVVFMDSMNYFQTSLANIGHGIGYKKINITLDEIEKKDHKSISYCIRDCTVLYKALQMFFDLLRDKFNINPRLTIASNAMAIFQTNYLTDDVPISPLDLFFKDSYYGGRTEVFKKHLGKGFCYDVNSLYPHSMLGRFPDPSQLKKQYGTEMLKELLENELFEGSARVTLQCNLNIPILPYKAKNKNYFPTGEITGTYNFNELRYALENGYELIEGFEIVYSRGIESPFAEYVNTIYQMRNDYKKEGSAFELFCKYLLNSLYGKFGEYHEIREIGCMDDIQEDEDNGTWVFDEIGNTGVGYWKLCDESGEIITEYAKHNIFAWCSYVTSYARITLYEFMKKANFDIYYCDTDSLFTPHELPSSKTLGDMKKEYDILNADFVKPKHYSVNSIKAEGKGFLMMDRTTKIKGLRDVTDIYKTEQSIRRVIKTKEALIRNLNAGDSIITPKQISLDDEKRNWIDENNSIPFTVKEIYS